MLKQVLIVVGLFLSVHCLGQVNVAQTSSRELRTLTFSGSGYELGLQHGQELKTEIGEIITAWKQNVSTSLGKEADSTLKAFFAYAEFEEAIQQWTPELYQEVRGIADGSEQAFTDVLVLNLLDEFWVYINNLHNHHCSAVGVAARNGQPAYLSQNMDLETYTDGFQLLMRLSKTDRRPEQLILTHPGLIALNGLNEAGVGVCVNTLMQLKATATGLPVAFVIRRILHATDKEDILSFMQNVPHASGQNYLIGIKQEVIDLEASAHKVVRYAPNNPNGTVYHTNHPMVNDDLKPWFEAFDPNLAEAEKPTDSNSFLRFQAVKNRVNSEETISDELLKAALRSRDDPAHPVCRTNLHNGGIFTFASVLMTVSGKPYLEILAGPPDESEYQRFDFEGRK